MSIRSNLEQRGPDTRLPHVACYKSLRLIDMQDASQCTPLLLLERWQVSGVISNCNATFGDFRIATRVPTYVLKAPRDRIRLMMLTIPQLHWVVSRHTPYKGDETPLDGVSATEGPNDHVSAE